MLHEQLTDRFSGDSVDFTPAEWKALKDETMNLVIQNMNLISLAEQMTDLVISIFGEAEPGEDIASIAPEAIRIASKTQVTLYDLVNSYVVGDDRN